MRTNPPTAGPTTVPVLAVPLTAAAAVENGVNLDVFVAVDVGAAVNVGGVADGPGMGVLRVVCGVMAVQMPRRQVEFWPRTVQNVPLG